MLPALPHPCHFYLKPREQSLKVSVFAMNGKDVVVLGEVTGEGKGTQDRRHSSLERKFLLAQLSHFLALSLEPTIN